MHQQAYEFVARAVDALPFPVKGARIVECGALNVNGTIRPLFAGAASFVGFDRRPGRDVDLVAEAADFTAEQPADVFVSCGSIEHAPRPADITECAARCLRDGGYLILHGEQGRPHGDDGGQVEAGQVFTDFTPDAARELLAEDWEVVSVDTWASDVYVVARRVAAAPKPSRKK